jgi:hypothetical protein
MKRKHLTETPVCPRERLVIISYTTGLSFALKRIGPLAAIIITVFYLIVLYLLALPNIPENLFASIYSESLIKTTCQHLLLLVGFDTLIYQKYCDTPPILVDHHPPGVWSCQCQVIPAKGGVTTRGSDASSLMSLLTRFLLSSKGRNPFESYSFRGMYHWNSLSFARRSFLGPLHSSRDSKHKGCFFEVLSFWAGNALFYLRLVFEIFGSAFKVLDVA